MVKGRGFQGRATDIRKHGEPGLVSVRRECPEGRERVF